MFLTWFIVSAIFGAVYLAFIVVFFLVFGGFQRLLEREALQKEKEDSNRKCD